MCDIITKEGHQCTKPVSKEIDNYTLCTIHYKSYLRDKTKLTSVREEEPWKRLGLPPPSKFNGAREIAKIRTKIARGPTVSEDTEGCIYVYQIVGEEHLDYFKIGKSSKTAEERTKEWQKHHKLRLMFSQAVECNVGFIERVIHLYLNYCRLYRYPLASGGGFKSVYVRKPDEIIEDGQHTEEQRVVAKNKLTEFFCCPLDEVQHVIETLAEGLQLVERKKN